MLYFKTYEEYLLNSNFYKWFGSSKVVENGKPMVCFHGSNKIFNRFDSDKIGHGSGNYGHYGYGFYFSDDIREAKQYGDNILKCYLKIETPFTGTDEQYYQLKRNGITSIDDWISKSIRFDSLYKQFYIIDSNIAQFIKNIKEYGYEIGFQKSITDIPNLKNYELNDIADILEYTDINPNSNGIPDYIYNILVKLGIDLEKLEYNKGFEISQSLHWITDLGNLSKEVTKVIQKLGYDGVIYGSEYVVFESNQIKSVNNDGSWDFDDPNIYS